MSDFGYPELSRAALGFALEDETWPVFLAWARVQHATPESHAWVETASLAATRSLWLANSPDPDVRALAEVDTL